MIFVTGGTGFLGRHLVPSLCRAGHTVRVLSRQPDKHPWLSHYPNVEIIHGDLLDRDTLIKGIAGCQSVIHAGGMFRFWGNPEAFEATNALGTQYVLEAAVQAQVGRFIHISTVAVIGQPDPAGVVDETHPAHPVDAYQRSKWEGEQAAVRAYERDGLPLVVLRPGAYYGPLGHYAFNRLFFKDPMRGIIMQVNGGRYIIFPAYITDVVQGVMKALEVARLGEVYNICGDWIAHKDAFDIICQEANIHWPRLNIPGWMGIAASRALEAVSSITRTEPFWPLNLRSYVYNNWRVSSEKARRELGFTPIDFREGARQTIAWYRAGEPDDLPEFHCL
jgi:nucleoside-diphosphate-sugar epimerase